MAEIEEIPSTKNEVMMHTKNPVHELNFKWIIENPTKCSNRLVSPNFLLESNCKPEFRLIAKLSPRYPNVTITNLNLGIERTDEGERPLYGTINVKITSTNGDVYCRKISQFSCFPNGPPFYFLSELFADSWTKLITPNSFSSDTVDNLISLRARKLVGAYKDSPCVFKLYTDALILEGYVRTFGCCVVSEYLPIPDAQDKFLQKSYTSELLSNFKDALESETLTDVILRIGSDRISAHRFVLQYRSSVFKEMLENANPSEDGNAIVEVKNVTLPVLRTLVRFLYTGQVQNEEDNDECKDFNIDELSELYDAAHKFKVLSLRRACSDMIRSLMDDHNVCQILRLAVAAEDTSLKKDAIDYIIDNYATIEKRLEWEFILAYNPRLAADVLQKICNVSERE